MHCATSPVRLRVPPLTEQRIAALLHPTHHACHPRHSPRIHQHSSPEHPRCGTTCHQPRALSQLRKHMPKLLFFFPQLHPLDKILTSQSISNAYSLVLNRERYIFEGEIHIVTQEKIGQEERDLD